jgi:hypothetical protein
MTDRIKVAEYHNRPLVELEFPDGEVWKLRQPLEADYWRMTEIEAAHRKRVLARAHEVAEQAKARAEEAKARISAGSTEDPDSAARALIEEEADEERLPLDVTRRYLQAAIVAVFVAPEQTPESVLERLGPDIIHTLDFRLREVFGGDAAKKRLAAASPETT